MRTPAGTPSGSSYTYRCTSWPWCTKDVMDSRSIRESGGPCQNIWIVGRRAMFIVGRNHPFRRRDLSKAPGRTRAHRDTGRELSEMLIETQLATDAAGLNRRMKQRVVRIDAVRFARSVMQMNAEGRMAQLFAAYTRMQQSGGTFLVLRPPADHALFETVYRDEVGAPAPEIAALHARHR